MGKKDKSLFRHVPVSVGDSISAALHLQSVSFPRLRWTKEQDERANIVSTYQLI